MCILLLCVLKRLTLPNEHFEIGLERCSIINFAVKKLVDLFIYRESVYLLINTDVLHADIFPIFMIWEQFYRLFVLLELFVETIHTA